MRGKRSDGARALDAYLRERSVSLPNFCDANGLHEQRYSVQRAVNGETERVSVELAFDLEAATGGSVKAAWWHPSTIRWDRDENATGTEG